MLPLWFKSLRNTCNLRNTFAKILSGQMIKLNTKTAKACIVDPYQYIFVA